MVVMVTTNLRSTVVEFDFLPGQTFPVTLAETETEADPRTRTFAVVFSMPKMPQNVRILPGMTATLRVERAAVESRSDEWSIPASAIFIDPDGKRYVWKVDAASQTVGRVAIQAGDVRGDQVLVRGGLVAGDTIVTAGVNHLQEGAKIRPLPPEAAQTQ